MILLFDIGNTHTHVGLANEKRVVTKTDMPTHDWFGGKGRAKRREDCRRKKNHRRGPVQRRAARDAVRPQNCPRGLETGNARIESKNPPRRGH
jgi:hypothetical protein